MSARLNIRSSSSRTQQPTRTPRQSCSKLDGQQHSSKSTTLSAGRPRSHEPKPRPSTSMESPTPTPRKPRRHNKGSTRPEQREPLPALVHDNDTDQDPSSEHELYGLLGVPPSEGGMSVPPTPSSCATLVDTPKKGGLLAISKEDIVEAAIVDKKKGRREGKKRTDDGESAIVERKKGRRGGKKEVDQGEIEGKDQQTDGRTPAKRGGKKSLVVEKGFAVAGTPSPSKAGFRLSKLPDIATRGSVADYSLSDSSSALPEKQSRHSPYKVDDAEFTRFKGVTEPLDMTALSQSLPGQHGNMLANMTKNRTDQRTKSDKGIWDMPATTGTEDPTWQQKLQSSPEPRKAAARGSERKPRKAPSAFQSSVLNPSRPAHNRRASTDGLPVPRPPKSAPPLQLSAFDHEIPYHTGFNTNRAPQTPSKADLRDLRETLASSPLPLREGDFPRINKNKVFDNVLGADNHQRVQSAPSSTFKYAGSTSHYSPHATALSKPELDEF